MHRILHRILAGTGLDRIAAAARQAFADLEHWLYTPRTAHRTLGRIEVEQERRGRALLRQMLQAHIHSRGDGYVGEQLLTVPPDSQPAILYRYQRLRTRQFVTVFGPVSVPRAEYGALGQVNLYPLDAELGLPARSFSYEIQRRLAKAAVKGPFDEAVENLTETTGVALAKRTAEQIVAEASVDFAAFYTHQTAQLDPQSGPLLVASVDGKGVPMIKPHVRHHRPPHAHPRRARLRKGQKRNKKRMATVGTVFTQKPNRRSPESVVASLFAQGPKRKRRYFKPEQKRVWASLLAGKAAFLLQVSQEMLRRDPDHQKTWIAVTDGERALQRQVLAALPGILLILDLLHVLEKLWTVSYVFHPEGSEEASDFVRARILRILRGEVSQVIKGLRQMATKHRLQGQKRKTVREVTAYYYRNRSYMRYDFYLRQGYPIASGSVEGACKNLVKDRMERSGMRWTPPMAEAVLQLRAAYLSDDFEEYWDFHVQEDQKRLYGSPKWRALSAKK